MLDDGNGQGRALNGVGAGAQLIKQNQAVPVRLLQNGDNGLHVGGERGQALLNALLVADVRQHPLVHGHLAAIPHRDMQAALGHQSQQAQSFQGNRLAAGVGAGDDQGIKSAPQFDIDGHRRFFVQQRMAGLPQADQAVSPHLGPDSVHFVAQFAPGKDQVQLHQGVVVPLDVPPVGGGIGRQLR